MKARIYGYHDQVLFPGEKIYFKEHDKNEWSGPGKVLGLDGKVALVKYGNNFKRVHISKIVKEGEEFSSPANRPELCENPDTNDIKSPQEDNEKGE